MIVGWKAWFVDVPQQQEIHIYSSDDMGFEELPQDGCLALILYNSNLKPDGNNRSIIYKTYDYYFKAGQIYGADVDVRERNVPSEIATRYINPHIIRGIWTDDATMEVVEAAMREHM